MKKLILKAALLACAAIAGNAQALPVADQGTWETTLLGRDIDGNAVAGDAASAVFLYDAVLNVTWLRDANYSMTMGYSGADSYGGMNWGAANDWAAGLVVGSHDDWRLPTMISNPLTTPVSFFYSGGTDYGYNVRTKSGNSTQFEAGQTVYSEMAHLWYSTLGNKAYCPPFNASCSGAGFPQPGWGLTNTGNFQNMAALYWSGLEYSLGKSWAFNSGDGVQYFQPKTDNWWAMAVLDGDVLVSAVPEPETYALMLAGLAVVGATAKRKASRAQ